MAISCPHCGAPMTRDVLPEGVSVDVCPAHGVWLDVGELERIRLMASAGAIAEPAPKGQAALVLENAGKRLADSAVFGAGATIGSRIVDGIIGSVFSRR